MLIATIEKTAHAELQVSLRLWKGHKRLDARTFAGPKGDRFATKKGFSIDIQQIDDLLRALKTARQEALRQGWLDEGGGP